VHVTRIGIYLLSSVALVACSDLDDGTALGRGSDVPSDEVAPEPASGPDSGEEAPAPEPDPETIWTPANKDGFGTAMSLDSKVWYTLQGGRLSEVYYPDLGTPSVRTLEFVVTDGSSFASVVSQSSTREVRLVDQDSLIYEQTNTDDDGRWRLTARYVTDPARSSVLVDVRFESLSGSPYALYAVYDPSLANDGADDAGWSEEEALVAADPLVGSALAADPAFVETDSGVAGTSDGWTEISAGYRLTGLEARAEGDVVQTGRTAVDGVEHDRVTLTLGFGADAAEALSTATRSLDCGFESVAHDYVASWHDYVASLASAPASLDGDLARATYRVSTMVLAASEDKTYRGAYIASPTMPWVWGNGLEAPSGAYHLVWSRDLYEIATALVAMGDTEGAGRALDYLFERQQKPDGSFPQNSTVDGTPHWGNLQLDEVADPILLAHLLGRDDAATWSHVKKAADFLVNFSQEGQNAPWTPQERWENQGGFSPATIAAEIAGLEAAAEIAEANGDDESAALYRDTAASWRDQVDTWTLTTTGPYSAEPYYLRLSKDGDASAGTTYSVGDGGPSAIDQREVVDTSFLALVRFGIKDPLDPAILSSLPVVDEHLMADTPNGKFWRRYNFDGYGETPAGAPWDISEPDTFATIGRAWPILAGERGEYELSAGNTDGGREALAAMAASGNDGYMLPEQVWDDQSPSGDPGFAPGEGTFSATPLAWSHAVFIRLAHGIEGDCRPGELSRRPLR
jgi:glucoamylase